MVLYREDDDGTETTLATAFVGDVIGEIGHFSDGTRITSVRAVEPTLLLRLGYADLRQCLDSLPNLAHRFLSVLTQRLRESDIRYHRDLRRRHVAERSLRNLNQYLDVSEAMSLGTGIEDLIERIVHGASKLMKADRGTLFILDPSGRTDELCRVFYDRCKHFIASPPPPIGTASGR